MNCIPIEWNTTAPDPALLQTGDLLFPRLPTGRPPPADVGGPRTRELNPGTGGRRVGDVLGVRAGLLAQEPDGAGFRPADRMGQTRVFASQAGAADVVDPNDPDHLHLLLRILQATFGDITQQWLHMTVDEFVRHPLFQLLVGAMNQDLGDGFFVGHCAMVLRETSGRHDPHGGLFVIEANVTDFSHYRVSIHPYHVPEDPQPDPATPPSRMSGWVNFRAALGQKVWAARPACLELADTAATNSVRDNIIAAAKSQLGRPYGFFDSPRLGDTDRLYCSEFVLASFRQASKPGFDLKVDDCCTWQWLIDHLGDTPFRAQLLADLRSDRRSADGQTLYDRVIGERFFLLTVQMLWRSGKLARTFYPPGEDEYA